MTELNKILLIGRLTKDPDLRYTPAGAAVVTLRLASNHTYRVKEEKKEEVLFVNATLWGKSAELAKQYLQKGREVLVEGRLQQNDWQDKNGQKRTSYRINCDRFSFIGGSGRQGEAREATPEEGSPPAESFDAADTAPRGTSPPAAEDDLPF